jgi:hypothetical protein
MAFDWIVLYLFVLQANEFLHVLRAEVHAEIQRRIAGQTVLLLVEGDAGLYGSGPVIGDAHGKPSLRAAQAQDLAEVLKARRKGSLQMVHMVRCEPKAIKNANL